LKDKNSLLVKVKPYILLLNIDKEEQFYQEIIKDNGRFYLANTIYPNYNKEITREMATEIWQSCNMKERSNISMNFDLK